MNSRLVGFLRAVFRFSCSLKLAVIVLLSLAVSLAVATTLESAYDTATAQFWVYRSSWFFGLLVLLGINLIAVMVDRYPWKPRHIPFLLAHVGILILLAGSWVTQKYGLDGSLRITEGETSNVVEIDQPVLVLTEGNASDPANSSKVHTLPIQWVPPGVKFRKVNTFEEGLPYDLTVDDLISHADMDFSFVPNERPAEGHPAFPAVRLKLSGGPMNLNQDFWLWAGDRDFALVEAGPAILSLNGYWSEASPAKPEGKRAQLNLRVEKDGNLSYSAASSMGGKPMKGQLAKDKMVGQLIETGWRGGLKVTVQEWIPDASVLTKFRPARMQYGNMAPPSAIHVIAGKGGEGSDVWLGVGSRAVLHVGGKDVEIGYFSKRVLLPFGIHLERFTIERYAGTMRPSSFSSRVAVKGASAPEGSQVISMNEPLEFGGITFYQASYEDAMPRPVTSILSVNRDPGRGMKYWGSLLIVIGSILLFAMKYRQKRTANKTAAAIQPVVAPVTEVTT